MLIGNDYTFSEIFVAFGIKYSRYKNKKAIK